MPRGATHYFHDAGAAPNKPFLDSFPLIERAAADDRNFVKKGVSWALRGIGHRNPALHAASVVGTGTGTWHQPFGTVGTTWHGWHCLRAE